MTTASTTSGALSSDLAETRTSPRPKRATGATGTLATDMNESSNSRSRRIVATRIFRSETAEEVVVTICEPILHGAEEWYCEFTIVGAGHDIRHNCTGVDGLDALLSAIHGVRAHLETIGHSLTWLDGSPGDLGIPRPIPTSYGSGVEKQLIALINGEIARLTATKWGR